MRVNGANQAELVERVAGKVVLAEGSKLLVEELGAWGLGVRRDGRGRVVKHGDVAQGDAVALALVQLLNGTSLLGQHVEQRLELGLDVAELRLHGLVALQQEHDVVVDGLARGASRRRGRRAAAEQGGFLRQYGDRARQLALHGIRKALTGKDKRTLGWAAEDGDASSQNAGAADAVELGLRKMLRSRSVRPRWKHGCTKVSARPVPGTTRPLGLAIRRKPYRFSCRTNDA